ncbi:MAG: hypothetical protein ACO1Q7_18430 [Gemmatimonas sp.]
MAAIVFFVVGLVTPSHGAHAQSAGAQVRGDARDTAWKDTKADSLINRAIALRSRQLADSTLLSYHATAHGFLAFLAQLGEGYIIPPKVVQSEELALSLSWWAPGNSSQQLVGRRDTTLLPADVGYYRDRYAVVLDNLPDRIRLGDGYDVADVPHPLSTDAATRYEFRVGNGFQIGVQGRRIVVDEVEFRPRDQSRPSAVGSVYLEHETGAVVRLSMTFTRAAILDKRIETLVVTLENSLVRDRYWLPHRQEVEVSRTSTWFDIPARGIVRGHWEIYGYDVNERIPDSVRTLPRWSSRSAAQLKAYKFEGTITEGLPPEMRLAGDADVAQARKMAEQVVKASALTRVRSGSAYARNISDFARFTRTEGVAVGAGISRHWGESWQAKLGVRYGVSDEQVKGRLLIGKGPALGGPPALAAFVERDYRDVATPERSGVANTLSAIIGSDFTTQVDVYAAGVLYRRSPLSRFSFRLAAESDAPLRVAAKPLLREFEPTLPAWHLQGGRLEMRGGGSSFASENPATRRSWSLNLSAGAYRGDSSHRDSVQHYARDWSVRPVVARISGDVTFERGLPGERVLLLRTIAGGTIGQNIPPQWLTFAGGVLSAPGYQWSSLAGKAVLSERVEFRQPVPGAPVPLGKYGRAPGRIILAPYVQANALGGADRRVSLKGDGVYPSVGMGALFFFDLLRVDGAYNLRDRRWSFGFDIDRGFWGIL